MVNELLPLKSLKTDEIECEEVSNREKFVLVIVTGGTLCMKKNEKGNYVPAQGFLNNAIGNISLLHDKEYYDEFIAPRKMLSSSVMSHHSFRLIYHIKLKSGHVLCYF